MSGFSDKSALKRLEQALQASSSLSCEQVREQLELLVDAESAGEDVDDLPQFQEVLRHLESCEACTELYAQLSEDVEDFFADDAPAFVKPHSTPTFFAPARQTNSMRLHVFGGLAQRFRLWLQVPSLPVQASAATLSAPPHTLFNDEIEEIANKPVVSVSLFQEAHTSNLQVTIKDLSTAGPWEVRLEYGDFQMSQTTNEQGIAVFADVPVQSLSELTIHCSLV